MIDILDAIIPYISGLWTLPWIVIGFVCTLVLSRLIGEQTIDRFMKKIGLILLYFFVPVLLFRIFLNQDFGAQEIEFAGVTCIVLVVMYLLAYGFARWKVNSHDIKGKSRQTFIKTLVTNQGRSAAFIGGVLLASPWFVEAAIFIALVGIVLFAVIPYWLAFMHKHESKITKHDEPIHALPWYLRLYPWYLILFAIAAVALHSTTGVTINSLGDPGIVLKFYTALTIPAALYYVGAGIHPRDLEVKEMKKLFSLQTTKQDGAHWVWIRNIFVLTVVITPLVISGFFALFFYLNVIPKSWFAVIAINSILPITSTNMFLIPYGIDKKTTALSVTWTTIVCVPIVVLLIYVFTLYI